jgi:hypothetical protein
MSEMQVLQEHSPATRAVALGKKRGFFPALAACGGGHIPVPGVVLVEFHGLRVGS